MMCHPESTRISSHMGTGTCGCCGCGPSGRRFLSSKEVVERLENYKDQITKELAGIEERLNELRDK